MKKGNEARLLRGSRQPRLESVLRPRVASVPGWLLPRLEARSLVQLLLRGRDSPLLNLSLK